MSQLFAPVLGRVIISQTEIIRKRIVDELMGRGVVVVGPISEQPVASATASGTPVCYRMHSFNSLDRAIDDAIREIIETSTDAAVSLAASGAPGDLLNVSVSISFVREASPYNDHGDTGFFQCQIHGFNPQKEPHAPTT